MWKIIASSRNTKGRISAQPPSWSVPIRNSWSIVAAPRLQPRLDQAPLNARWVSLRSLLKVHMMKLKESLHTNGRTYIEVWYSLTLSREALCLLLPSKRSYISIKLSCQEKSWRNWSNISHPLPWWHLAGQMRETAQAWEAYLQASLEMERLIMWGYRKT